MKLRELVHFCCLSWNILYSLELLKSVFGFCFVVVVESLSLVRLLVTLWIAAHQASLVLHSLLEFAQTHVYWAGDTIQPSHPLSFPSPPAFSLSQHQSFSVSRLFTWRQSVGASASVSVLPMDIQG